MTPSPWPSTHPHRETERGEALIFGMMKGPTAIVFLSVCCPLSAKPEQRCRDHVQNFVTPMPSPFSSAAAGHDWTEVLTCLRSLWEDTEFLRKMTRTRTFSIPGNRRKKRIRKSLDTNAIKAKVSLSLFSHYFYPGQTLLTAEHLYSKVRNIGGCHLSGGAG